MEKGDEVDPSIRKLFPFAFPGGVEEKEPVEPPPVHPELEEFGFFELFQHVFDYLKFGDKVIDALKRMKANGDDLDDICKYVSELYTRGEVDIFERDWLHIAISAGKIGDILELSWEVMAEGQMSGPFKSTELAPKARVFAAMDATVRKVGSDEWIPIEKINFSILKL